MAVVGKVREVSDTAEALEQDFRDIGYSQTEAAAAARNVFKYDDM